MRAALPVVVLGITACQGGFSEEVGPDGIGNGRRLRAQFLEAGEAREQVEVGGAKMWLDTGIGADCSFQQTGPTAFHCMPPYVGALPGSTYYEDPQCTQPLAREPDLDLCTSDGPCYLGMYTWDGCAGWLENVREIAVDQPLALTVAYWQQADGSCTSAQAPPVLYRTGALQPLSIFVEGTLERHDAPGRIDIVNVVGSDGSRAPWHHYDEVLDVVCLDQSFDALGSPPSCIPNEETVGGGGVYAEDTCSQPLGAVPTGCGPPSARFALVGFADNRCTDVLEVHHLGDPVTPEIVYDEAGGACAAEPPDPYLAYFTIGELIPRDQLVEMPLTPFGEGRLRPLYHAPVDGTPKRAYGFFDSVLGVNCFVEEIEGVRRCLPTSAGVWDAFADAACTEPIVVAAIARWECWPDSPFPEFVNDNTTWEWWDVVEELPAGSVYEVDTSGACVVPTDVRYGSIGAVRPITDFVEMTPSE